MADRSEKSTLHCSASGTALPKNPIQDLNNTPSPGMEQDVQQIGGKSGPKPKVRPLAQKDPL